MTSPAVPAPTRQQAALDDWQDIWARSRGAVGAILTDPSLSPRQRVEALTDALGELSEAGARLIEAVARPDEYAPAEAHQQERQRAI